MSKSTIFQSYQDISCFKPVLYKQGIVFNSASIGTVPPMGLEPATPQSQVEHSTTEPLFLCEWCLNNLQEN